MIRLNILLLALIIVSSLALITSQHQARKRQVESAGQDANHGRAVAQNVRKGASDVRVVPGEGENAVRLVVHQRDRAIAFEGDDAVAHAPDDLTEKAIVGCRGGPRRGAFVPRRRSSAARVRTVGFGHNTAHELEMSPQRVCPWSDGCTARKLS